MDLLASDWDEGRHCESACESEKGRRINEPSVRPDELIRLQSGHGL